jgi:ribonuclease P protein component
VTPGLILQTARQAGRSNRPKSGCEDARPSSDSGREADDPAESRGDENRGGITDSRKVGNAVARNRARRRLRAAVAEVMPCHAKRGQDYVVIARAGTLTRPFDALVADLVAGLRRLGVYDRPDENLGERRDRSPSTVTERREG